MMSRIELVIIVELYTEALVVMGLSVVIGNIA